MSSSSSSDHLRPSTSANDSASVYRNEHSASSLKGTENDQALPKSPQEGTTADNSTPHHHTAISSVDPFSTNPDLAVQFVQKNGLSVPERRKKKPYKELTLEEKVELIRMAEENSSLSQASIAEKYSIAKSNVCRILQRKAEYLRAFESAGFAGSRKRKLRGDLANNLRHFRPSHHKPHLMSVMSASSCSNNPSDSVSDTPEASCIARPIPFDCGSRAMHANACASNETLRMHMAKQHSIARLFMCRCCNWAFPDKTSLHMHAKEEGKAVTLPILGKSASPDLIGNFPLPNFMHSGLGHAALQSLSHGSSPFASLPSIAGLPFSNESLAQFFPPLSLMQQNNEELMNKLRERLFINNLSWQSFQNHSQTNIINKLSKNDLPSLAQNADSVSSNSSTDESEEIQVIEDVEHHHVSPEEEQARSPKPTHDNDETVDDKNDIETDLIEKHPNNTISDRIPKDYFNEDDALRIDEPDDSPLNIVDHTGEPNNNQNSPLEWNGSSSSLSSATSCYHCNLLKSKLTLLQTRCSYLEVHTSTTQQETLRLREQNELLMGKLLECRKKSISFMQSEQSLPVALNEILKITLFQ